MHSLVTHALRGVACVVLDQLNMSDADEMTTDEWQTAIDRLMIPILFKRYLSGIHQFFFPILKKACEEPHPLQVQALTSLAQGILRSYNKRNWQTMQASTYLERVNQSRDLPFKIQQDLHPLVGMDPWVETGKMKKFQLCASVNKWLIVSEVL